MISISQIDPELSIYKKNKVVVFGCGFWGEQFLLISQRLNIDIVSYCDNNETLWGTSFHEIPVISPKELAALNHKSLVVQLAISDQYAILIQEQLKEMSILNVIEPIRNTTLFLNKNRYLVRDAFIEKYPEISIELKTWVEKNQAFYRKKYEKNKPIHPYNPEIYQHIFVCQPGKTGDHTITSTYSKYSGVEIKHSHSPEEFDRTNATQETVKVVTALREPISRDISFTSHLLAAGIVCRDPNIDFEEYKIFFQERKMQPFFEKQIARRMRLNEDNIFRYPYKSFFERFKNSIMDLTQDKFDQEKGYTIIKEGNIEVFFYQLEKLNDLVPELSEWVGVPFTELINGNEASSKWIAKSYKQAQKELKFSQEYFDTCYNDPYVQHCYSQEDIEKFKERWRGNIDPNL